MAASNSVDLAELIDHYHIVKYKLSPLFEFWKTLERARRYVYSNTSTVLYVMGGVSCTDRSLGRKQVRAIASTLLISLV